MRKMRKRIIGLTLAMVMILSMATVAMAAVSPRSVSIRGNVSTMTVGQKAEFDAVITPYNANVRDRNIIWSSSNASVVRILENYDDETEVMAVGAGQATITVKINGTQLSATKSITVNAPQTSTPSTPSTGTDYDADIEFIQEDLEDIYSRIQSTKPSGNWRTLRAQVKAFEREIENAEDDLDYLEDEIKYSYRRGNISYSEYRSLNRAIDSVENYMDRVEDYLEYKFGDIDD